jgi:3'-5' exoribonuclease
VSGERIWIRDLEPGLEINESYVVRSKDKRQRRQGGDFLSLQLADRSGEVAGLVWEKVPELDRLLSVGSVVEVSAQVQRYNQRLQLVIRKARLIDPETVDESVYLRSAADEPEALWARFQDLIEGLGNTHLKQLLFRIFADEEVATAFKLAPAARSMHHAYRSGLIEHTLSMVQAGRRLAEHYRLDVDLVTAGILLHDLGKVWELSYRPSIEYTTQGRLLGHITMVVLAVERQLSELASFPAELRLHLLHILLSHHGQYAYGSPRRPKTPEALLVHAVDDLDSKLATMIDLIGSGGETGEDWTAYSPILERNVYRRRPEDI